MRDMYGCKDGISFGIRHCGMVWRTTNSLSCGTVCTVIPVIVSEERYGTRSLSYGYSIPVIVSEERYGTRRLFYGYSIPVIVSEERYGTRRLSYSYSILVIVSEERYGTRSLSYGYSILVIVIQLTLAVAVAAVTKAPLVTTIF